MNSLSDIPPDLAVIANFLTPEELDTVKLDGSTMPGHPSGIGSDE
jgi:hypothetical protein